MKPTKPIAMIVTVPLLAVLCTVPAPAAELTLSESDWIFADTSPDTFTFENDTLAAERRSYQSATILSRRSFENFSLEFEFLLHRWCELILLLHAPENDAYRAGLEIVLSDHFGSAPNPYVAGALLGTMPPKSVAVKEDGEWNTCILTTNWPRLTVVLNGETVQDVDLSQHEELQYKLRRGRIGFRDLLGWGFEVRNLELGPLPDSEHGTVLFNGRDFTGWTEVRTSDAKWRVEDGILVGFDGNGYLQYENEYENFDLRLYYRTSPTANGGVFFRWLPDDSDRGNEIQILDIPDALMPSGSVYGIARAEVPFIRPQVWHLLQLYVDGPSAVTLLDGRKVAETDALTKIRPGRITLQMHKEKSQIDFKGLVLVPRD